MKQELTKLEMLWIRASKSKEPEKRLVSFYRRFYTRHSSKVEEVRVITTILAELCDKYFPVKLEYVLQCSKYIWNKDKTFNQTMFSSLVTHIRRISREDLQTTNFIPPKRFR